MANYTLSARILADASNFNKNIQLARASLSNFSASLKSFGKGMTSIGKSLQPVTLALTGLTGGAAVTSVNFIKLYESSMVVFEKMLGGSKAAQGLYSDLLGVAKASTFSQETFLQAGKSLVGVGVSADSTKKYLQAASDAVTAFGGTSQDVTQLSEAFKKTATNGRMSMEEVNMMSDAGVNVLQILGNEYGVTTDAMREMISSGAVPAEEGLAKLTDGIENGTDGVNGMTQAMAGMSEAMKGKTLTGALDSMHSSVRSFALSLLGLNPTLEETDAGYAQNQKHIAQLTAALVTINGIIPNCQKLFQGITDKVGLLLDKLVGANVAWDDTEKKWTNVQGVLGRLNQTMASADPEKLRIVGDVLLAAGAAAPMLMIAGKGIEYIAGAGQAASVVLGAMAAPLGNVIKGFEGLGIQVTGKMPEVLTKISSFAQPFLAAFGGLFNFAAIAGLIFVGLGLVQQQFGDQLNVLFANIRAKGPEFVTNFCGGIAAKIPDIIAAGTQLVNNLLQTVITMAPSLIAGGINIVSALVSGIAVQLPSLIPQAINAVVTIADGLIQNLPTIISAGLQLILGLAKGLIRAIPQLIDRVPEIINHLVSALIQSLPELIDAGIQLTVAIAVGLIQAMPQIIACLPRIVSAIWDGLCKINWADLGLQIIKGIGSGLLQVGSAIGGLINKAGEAISQGFKNFFHINSPSKLMADKIGSQLPAGIGVGILKNVGTAVSAARTASEAIADAMGSAQISAPQTALALPAAVSTAPAAEAPDTGVFDGLSEGVQADMEMIRTAVDANMTAAKVSAQTQSSQLAADTTANMMTANQQAQLQTGQLAAGTAANMTAARVSAQTQSSQMSAFVINASGKMTAGASANLQTLSGAAGQYFPQMLVTATNDADKMRENVGTAFTGMNNQAKSSLSVFPGIVRSGMEPAVNYVGTLPSTFNSYAVQMMQGLVSGINAEKSNVMNATSGMVDELKKTFIEGLGIHSPAKFGEYVGLMLDAGIVGGLSEGQVLSFTNSMVGEMKNAFAGGSLDMNQLVTYLDDDTLKLIDKLNRDGDATLGSSQSASGMIWPASGEITSWFGARPASDTNGVGSTNHGGLDIGAPYGAPIAAAMAGTVTLASEYGGYGNAVEIDHGNGYTTLYGHMSQIQAAAGQKVSQGQTIGLVGSTGNSTGPHLHFSVFQNGNAVDPYPFLQGAPMVSQMTMAQAIQQAYNIKKGIGVYGLSGNWMGGSGAAVAQAAISQALSLLGMSQSYVSDLMWAAYNESGYNPNAINDWDSNAAMGDPSRGLFQTIGSTFSAYMLPGHGDIWNPLDNTLAAIRYMIDRYGSIDAVVGPRRSEWYGYADGTNNARRGLAWVGENGPEIIDFGGGERVYTNRQSTRMMNTAPRVSVPSVAYADEGYEGYGRRQRPIRVEVTSVMDGRKVGYGSAKYVDEKNTFDEKRRSRIGGIV